MDNHFGKTSKLMIKAGLRGDKTILEDVAFTAPFKVMHPFYEKKDFMTIMCLTASAGIMAGDEQEFTIEAGAGSKLEFVSQAYEKIHKMESGCAKRTAHLTVAKNACLYYNPQPTLPFKDSAFQSKLQVFLEDASSQFILKEVLSAGRCARNELFEYRYFHNLIQIYDKGRLLYMDNTRLEPDKMALRSIGLYEGYTHVGSLILCHVPMAENWFQKARSYLGNLKDAQGGITRLNATCTVIRLLGYQSEILQCILDNLLVL